MSFKDHDRAQPSGMEVAEPAAGTGPLATFFTVVGGIAVAVVGMALALVYLAVTGTANRCRAASSRS